MIEAALERYLGLLATLDASRLDALCACFADDVRFRDPFNDVRGRSAARAVFADMLAQLEDLRFAVTARALEAAPRADGTRVALVTWRLDARLPRLGGRTWRVDGSSAIRFDAAGLVCAHVDYWDAAGSLYERLPVLGGVLRALRRRLAVRV
ncbi:MAG: nuclear transport factor 2 family protein [Gammaproteobacteria bacterium]